MSDVSDVAQRRSRLPPAIQPLLERRLQGKREEQASPGTIPRLADRTVAPLSFAQQRLWFAHQWDSDIAIYNRPTALRLKGELHLPSLERSLSEILRRHEVLRTTFPIADGQPVQRVGASADLSLSIEVLTHLPQEERLGTAQQRMIEMLRRPFSLQLGPLFRVRLFRIDLTDHLLLFVTHYILFDGWSEVLFVNELCALYEFKSEKAGTLSDLPVQYADFAHWQRDQVREEALKAHIAYWRGTLAGVLPILNLPSDRPRPLVQTFHGATQSLVLSRPLAAGLGTISRQEGVTLLMTLLAAFKVLLYQYTGQEDIVVGVPITNRDQAEVEGLIGCFVNTLVLRTGLSSAASGALTFRELLARVREVCLGAYAHQHLPFEKLVEELQPQRDLSRNPLFQVLFAVQNTPRPVMELTGLTVTPLALDYSRVRIDLECCLWEEGEAIQGALVYNTGLFDAATVARMAAHYQTLLESVVAGPHKRIAEIPMLSESERRQLVVEWNSTRRVPQRRLRPRAVRCTGGAGTGAFGRAAG